VPSYDDDSRLPLEPDEAVTWNESMEEAWDVEPTLDRLRRPEPEMLVEDEPTVTNVTRKQRKHPPAAAPPPTPARAPPALDPAAPPRASEEDSPWIVDEASMSSTIQPGERRMLPPSLRPAHGGAGRAGSSRPPSMAVPRAGAEPSRRPHAAPQLHPAERRLMPPDSLPPGPPADLPAHAAARPSSWPAGRGGTISQILGAPPRLRSVVPKAVLAVALMALALGAIVWLVL
jgi:hypothetical protein